MTPAARRLRRTLIAAAVILPPDPGHRARPAPRSPTTTNHDPLYAAGLADAPASTAADFCQPYLTSHQTVAGLQASQESCRIAASHGSTDAATNLQRHELPTLANVAQYTAQAQQYPNVP
jgi:hypothetical protein